MGAHVSDLHSQGPPPRPTASELLGQNSAEYSATGSSTNSKCLHETMFIFYKDVH